MSKKTFWEEKKLIFIRGAITAKENTKEEILAETKELLEMIVKKNHLKWKDVLSVQFTATRDLDAAYPAVAARELGLTQAALMCLQEMYVQNSLPKCIRCECFCASNKNQEDAVHIYLKGAQALRPDLRREDS